MYSYQIDTGSGWATVVPVVGSASLKTSRVAGQIFARTELDGVIKFTGTTANQLRGLSATKQTIPFRILWNATEIYRGRLNVRTEADAVSNETWHKVETVDGYEKLMKGEEVELNALGTGNRVKCDVDIFTWQFRMNTPFRAGEDYGFETTQDQANKVYIAEFTTSSEDEYLTYLSAGWFKHNATGARPNGQWQLMRSWNDSPQFFNQGIFSPADIINVTYDHSSAIENEFVIGEYISAGQFGAQPVLAGRVMATDYDSANNEYHYYILIGTLPPNEKPFTYNRFVRLDDFIEYAVGELDDSILFDANSFKVWDDEPETANLLYAAISDMKIDRSGVTPVEPSNPATTEPITWRAIWELLSNRPFQFVWYLEKIGGDNYFRVDHISNINKVVGSFNLTAYKGVNWSDGKTRYEWEVNPINRITRTTMADSIDFYGVDILLPSIEDGSQEIISMMQYYFDVVDTFLDSDRYPERGLVIITADKPSDYICRVKLGALTNLSRSNAELSIANLDETYGKFRMPFFEAKINGVLQTVDQERLRKLQAISAPVRTPDEVDFNSLVTTSVDDIEPIELSIPLDGTQGHAIISGRY